MLPWLLGLAGIVIYLVVLWDGFQLLVLPRAVGGALRVSHPYFRTTWSLYRRVVCLLPAGWREMLLCSYGPASLIVLIVLWVSCLILSFALLHSAVGTALNAPGDTVSFTTELYYSGTTFFTLGLGDVTPRTGPSRFVTVLEVGTGFGFLAVVIGYLPVLYQSFQTREVMVALLASRAGSPPCAASMLQCFGQAGHATAVGDRLGQAEIWAAETLGSILSHSVLAYYRSQHPEHSWLRSLALVLDTAAIGIVGVQGVPAHRSHLAFEMGVHCLNYVCGVFRQVPIPPERDRLPPTDFARLRTLLEECGMPLADAPDVEAQLLALRLRYEYHLNALSLYFVMPLPAWLPPADAADEQRPALAFISSEASPDAASRRV